MFFQKISNDVMLNVGDQKVCLFFCKIFRFSLNGFHPVCEPVKFNVPGGGLDAKGVEVHRQRLVTTQEGRSRGPEYRFPFPDPAHDLYKIV